MKENVLIATNKNFGTISVITSLRGYEGKNCATVCEPVSPSSAIMKPKNTNGIGLKQSSNHMISQNELITCSLSVWVWIIFLCSQW
jgi:hypothetical protein